MPFRMLIAGDFGGSSRQRQSAPVEIDRDNFETVLAGVRPVVELPIAGLDGQPVTLTVRELDDLHPDRLWRTLPIFEAIRATAEPEAKPVAPRAAGAGLLDDILASTADLYGPTAAGPPGDDWDQTLRAIAIRHAVPKPAPEQVRRVADTQKAAELLMQAILHSRPFQAVETAWYGIDLAVRRVETNEDLKIFIADIPKARAAELFASSEDEWSVVLGNYSFGVSGVDLKLLGEIARAAAEARTPFIAAAHSSLLGWEERVEAPDARERKPLPEPSRAAWEALRRSPEAAWIGLAFPRILIRLPYGRELASCEDFQFEETSGSFSRHDFAWANPVFACAAMLGESWTEFGEAGVAHALENMPVCSWRSGTETRFQPAGESLLTDRAAEAVLEGGVIPLMSSKHGNEIRVPRFQAISDPPVRLQFHEE